MNRARSLAVCCALLFASTMVTPLAEAVTSSWTNNAGGTFTTAANWSSGVPDDADIAVFDRGSGVTYTVSFPLVLGHGGDIVNDRLVVGSNTVTFNPSGLTPADYLLDNTTTIEAQAITDAPVRGITIGADASDTAAVLVSHLALLEAVAATLGHAAGSSGTLALDQNNDLLNLTGGSSSDAELIIGRLGTGVLNVSNGADVTVNGSTGGMFPLPAGSVILGRSSPGNGTANISGAGSTLDINAVLIVGDAGTGELNITAGGLVESTSAFLGNLAGSSGMATVSGANSKWRVLSLFVGNGGAGTLDVLDGGAIEFFNPSGNMTVASLGTLNLDTGTVGGNVNNSGDIHVTGPATIAGSLTIAVDADTLVDWGAPCCAMVFNVGGPITNSGTFTIASAVEQDVTVQLAAGQTFTNNATGVVNLIGPADLNADNLISGKHIIAGNVANHGEMNVRTNTKIDGSLNIAVDAATVVNPAEPCCGMSLEVAGDVSNSGTFTMQVDSIEPCCGVTLELAPGQVFANSATGVVNLNGPQNVPEGETIESKHVIAGEVVNEGQIHVRTNAEITGTLYVGSIGNGMLEITNTGKLSNVNGYIGDANNSTGQALVDGDGAVWTNSSSLYVGNAGNGTLGITGGGVVFSADGHVGFAVGGSGFVTVDGSGSSWNNTGGLFVGDEAGSGTLEIKAGAVVSSVSGSLGEGVASTGVVTVDGHGSMWTVAGDLYVGKRNFGVLQITNGGSVVSQNATASWSDGNAQPPDITVDGADSTWTITNDLIIGNRDLATLHISGGGQVNSAAAWLGVESGGQGVVFIDGVDSKLDSAEDLVIGAEGDATLSVTNGGTAEAAGMIIGALGRLQGDGHIIGTVYNGGTVAPGDTKGVLTITGDYIQENSGKLVVNVAGATPGNGYDQLAVAGAIALDGVVEVHFDENFTPQIGNRFEIITTAEPVGTKFAGAFLPVLPEGMDWGIQYGANLVSLAIGILGDYNANGTVDAGDYTVWRDTLGQAGVFLAADGDGDDDVDADDYQFWKAHFGETAAGGAALAHSANETTVPEPAAALLAVIGYAAACWRTQIPRLPGRSETAP